MLDRLADAERQRKQRANKPGFSTKKNAKWKLKNPEKLRAHKKVEYLVYAGKIKKQPCIRCGTVINVQAHHDDYGRPLDIMWLCQLHHRERHRELKELNPQPASNDRMCANDLPHGGHAAPVGAA